MHFDSIARGTSPSASTSRWGGVPPGNPTHTHWRRTSRELTRPRHQLSGPHTHVSGVRHWFSCSLSRKSLTQAHISMGIPDFDLSVSQSRWSHEVRCHGCTLSSVVIRGMNTGWPSAPVIRLTLATSFCTASCGTKSHGRTGQSLRVLQSRRNASRTSGQCWLHAFRR